MATLTASAWKRFYAEERARLGEHFLDALLERAPSLPCGEPGIFPHARLEHCGALIAAVAKAVVDSGAVSVLALGVLHGARELDQPLVAKARAGDLEARRALRRVHGPGLPGDHWTEEFSLDHFEVLLERAARRAGRAMPRLVKRFPFLVGEDPESLPGLDELRALLDAGAALVATTDPIHHGAGYETPKSEQRDAHDPATHAWARASIEKSFDLLASRDLAAFQAHTLAYRSDFRDTGPVLAALHPFTCFAVHQVEIVPYADVLGAPEPTWVAGALASVSR